MHESDEIERLVELIPSVFRDVPVPNEFEITVRDCCPDHDAWVHWCSKHTWQEFQHALEEGFFDPIEYTSLYPQAYLYFLPGVLLFSLQALKTGKTESGFFISEWVNVLVSLKSNAQRFKMDYVARFNPAQRSVIRRFLTLFITNDEMQDGYPNPEFVWARDTLWI